MNPTEAANLVADNIERVLQQTYEPMKAEVLIAVMASWRTYAVLLERDCTCGYGGRHEPYNSACDLFVRN